MDLFSAEIGLESVYSNDENAKQLMDDEKMKQILRKYSVQNLSMSAIKKVIGKMSTSTTRSKDEQEEEEDDTDFSNFVSD